MLRRSSSNIRCLQSVRLKRKNSEFKKSHGSFMEYQAETERLSLINFYHLAPSGATGPARHTKGCMEM